MQKLIDVYPLFEADKLFDKTYKSIKPVRFDEDALPVLRKMFDFSRLIDTFFCEHLPLALLYNDIPTPNPLLVDADSVVIMMRKICNHFEGLMRDVNGSNIDFPTAYYRDLEKVQTIIFKLKNTQSL